MKTEYQLATGKLKRLLKTQGISYRALAENVEMSESGIKKVLNAKDGSFQRLTEICKFAGVPLAEILAEQDTDIVDVTFSDQQQKLFLESPKCFALFWLLTYERETLPIAEKRLALDAAESIRLLRALDGVGLIKLHPGNRLGIAALKPIRWTGSGPFMKKIHREWALKFVNEYAQPEPVEGTVFQFRYFRMTEATLREFFHTLREVENEFLRRAIREMQSGAANLKHARWLSVADSKSFFS
ncbi:MAG: helix-turn-helix domain-containing protein [Bdellovibrionota bacterium]